MSYEPSESVKDAVGDLTTALAGICMALCLAVVLVAWAAARVPAARPALNRVSFRLMLWTMVLEVAYNLSYILLDPGIGTFNNLVTCEVYMYFQVATLATVNYLTAIIAINLVLSICLHKDTTLYETWYILVSFVLGFGITLVPVSLGHFGQDPTYGGGTCYFTSNDPAVRVKRLLLDLYLWQSVATLASIIAVVWVIATLIAHGREVTAALLGGQALNRDLHRDTLASLQRRLVRISLKITLYPIALVIIDVILATGDLYQSVYGVPDAQTTRARFALYCVYSVLYSAKSLFFVALAVFVDPCLVRGVRLAWAARKAARKDVELDSAATSTAPMLTTPSKSFAADTDDLASGRTTYGTGAVSAGPLGMSVPGTPTPHRSQMFDLAEALAMGLDASDEADADLSHGHMLFPAANAEPAESPAMDKDEDVVFEPLRARPLAVTILHTERRASVPRFSFAGGQAQASTSTSASASSARRSVEAQSVGTGSAPPSRRTSAVPADAAEIEGVPSDAARRKEGRLSAGSWSAWWEGRRRGSARTGEARSDEAAKERDERGQRGDCGERGAPDKAAPPATLERTRTSPRKVVRIAAGAHTDLGRLERQIGTASSTTEQVRELEASFDVAVQRL
ncbi:hypothetical protein Q5752_003239 [Cryptotrichosporon argae]